jgi:hypothetical protein
MWKAAFSKAKLSDVRVIMTIMCVCMVELLCQAPTGWILVLKYLLSGVCGHMWQHPVVADIKYHRFLRSWLPWCLPGTESPRA